MGACNDLMIVFSRLFVGARIPSINGLCIYADQDFECDAFVDEFDPHTGIRLRQL